MDKASRSERPLAKRSVPALKDEHVTPAECGKRFEEMLKDALAG